MEMQLMEKQKAKGTEYLERAMSGVFGDGKITSKLSQVLAHVAVKGTISYQETKEIIKDDPEDVLLLADEWRLLLSVNTAKSSSWDDRLLLLEDGETYEAPNVIQYLAKGALPTGTWHPEKAILELFKKLGDPAWRRIPGLVRGIAEEAGDQQITGNQMKKICLRLGLGKRVDGLIAALKAAGIISPKLRSFPEVFKAGSPIYELNPSVAVRIST